MTVMVKVGGAGHWNPECCASTQTDLNYKPLGWGLWVANFLVSSSSGPSHSHPPCHRPTLQSFFIFENFIFGGGLVWNFPTSEIWNLANLDLAGACLAFPPNVQQVRNLVFGKLIFGGGVAEKCRACKLYIWKFYIWREACLKMPCQI